MVWGLCIALIAGISRHPIPCALFQVPLTLFIIRSRRSWRLGCAYLAAACIFYLYGWCDSAVYQRGTDAFRDLSAGSRSVLLRGWISSYPRIKGGRSIFSLRTNVAGREIDIGITLTGFDYGYGDSIAVFGTVPATGIVDETADGGRARYMRSCSRSGFVRVRASDVRPLAGSAGAFAVRKVFWPAHSWVRNDVARALGARSGLPLALLLGEKDMVSAEARRDIAALGISHLFALSGLHLGLILGIVLFILAPLRYATTFLLCIILGMYVGTVGDLVSLQRAYTMVVIGCAAKKLQRPIQPIAILGRAFLLLLLLEPGILYSIACQFSFIATFAVLLCVARMSPRRESIAWKRCAHYFWASLKVSFYAQLFITPLALIYFGETSLITPLTTLLFLPLVFLLLIFSGICALAGAVSTGIGVPAYRCLGDVAGLFSTFLHAVAQVAPDPLRIEPPSLLLYYSGLALVLGLRKGIAWRILGYAVTLSSFFL